MGRAAILLVMGYSIILLFFGKNMASIGVESLDNALTYYENTQRYNIASAGANFACSQIYENASWRTGYSNVSFNGGTLNVTVTENATTNQIHLECDATYMGSTQTIIIEMRPSSFSKFAYYGGTSASAAAWETGDTIGGPSHTQGKLKTFGSPVFMGKATAYSGLTMSGSPKNPQFMGGFENGVNIPMPNNTSYNTIITAASTGGYAQTGGDLYLNFQSDGSVQWKTSSAASWNTQSLASFAPNGVIAIDKGRLHVQGVVNGRVTLASLRSSGSSGGTTDIDGDLTMAVDPRTDPSSDDMLGIVNYGDITIKDNSASSFTVQGALYSYQGGVQVEHGTSRPAGILNIYGGMMVQNLYPTSNGASGSSRKGYNLSLKFDVRMANDSPSFFPATGNYEIISWFE